MVMPIVMISAAGEFSQQSTRHMRMADEEKCATGQPLVLVSGTISTTEMNSCYRLF